MAPSWHQVQDLLFRVIPYVVFFQEEEKKAVEQLAKRVGIESGQYNGWNAFSILHPSLFMGGQPWPITPFRRPQQNVFLTELDKWREYRDLLRAHHNFIATPNEFAATPGTELGRNMSSHGVEIGFKTREGVAYSNFYNHKTQRRDTREMPLFEVSKDGVWAQLVSEPSCIKILGVVNTGRPKNLKSWVKDLSILTIDKLGFSMLFGHPMRIPSEDVYPHNSPTGSDKRFEKWKTIELEIDGATESFELNRLYRLWLRMGFELLFSPDEGQQQCVGILSEGYKAELLQHNEQAWSQLLEKSL